MNKIISLFLVLILLFAFVSCGENEDGTPIGMKLASNPEIVDYTLYVPDDWVVTSSTGMTMAQVSYLDTTNLIVTHHSQTTANSYSDSMNMLIAYLYGDDEVQLSTDTTGEDSGKKTYREYDETLLLKEGCYLNRLYTAFDTVTDEDGNEKSSFTMVEAPSATTLNKGDKLVAAISFMYTATLDGAEIQQKMIIAYDDAYYYNFTFTTPPALYETHADTFAAILEYFSFDD